MQNDLSELRKKRYQCKMLADHYADSRNIDLCYKYLAEVRKLDDLMEELSK